MDNQNVEIPVNDWIGLRQAWIIHGIGYSNIRLPNSDSK
jgi:hypothetical protein